MKNLRSWFLNNKRSFPWRAQVSPYGVWVSEVMLQQTRASVVVPYYEKWMQKFPTIADLADAPVEEVIKLWEGLGYYSRARNLQAGAKMVMEHYGGELPSNETALAQIKGIGPYTLGAILSFAFKKKAVALDGNVARVLARYFNVHDSVCKEPTRHKLRLLAEQLLPAAEPWIIMEALIELGATLCGRQPQCFICPLRDSCQAFAQGTAAQLPVKSKPPTTEQLKRTVAIIRCEDKVLVRLCPKGEIMAGLYEFPYVAGDQLSEIVAPFTQLLGALAHKKTLKMVSHTFTRYKATLYPHCFDAEAACEIEHHCWYPLVHLPQLAFSSGHKRILNQLEKLSW